jgi:hypothetical protein
VAGIIPAIHGYAEGDEKRPHSEEL